MPDIMASQSSSTVIGVFELLSFFVVLSPVRTEEILWNFPSLLMKDLEQGSVCGCLPSVHNFIVDDAWN
jgi:hypothetical protein